jgi:hypothetical protein
MITSGLLLGRPRSSNHTDAHIICVGLRDVPISVSGHEQVAKLLLDKGADVNAKGGYYGNALHVASVGRVIRTSEVQDPETSFSQHCN